MTGWWRTACAVHRRASPPGISHSDPSMSNVHASSARTVPSAPMREKYFERREIKEAIAFAEAGGIAVHRKFDTYHGSTIRGFTREKALAGVSGLRRTPEASCPQHGPRPGWGQPDERAKVAEKIAVKGLHMVKLQARRGDVVGDVAKRTLRIFNGSFKTIARTATRLEQASELTTHQGAARPVSTRSRRRPARRRAA